MSGKKVLVLGAGRVSLPAVNYLLDQDNIRVTVADINIEAAEAVAANRPRTRAVPIDATNKQQLEELVKGFDAVICLVNCWGMRLGWLPSGIVDSTARETTYKKDGKIIHLDNQHTFEHIWEIVINGERYEANANELIEPYLSLYGVEDAHSVMRGTLRYPGWRRTVLALRDLGFFRGKTRNNRGQTYDLTQMKSGRPTYKDFLNMLMGKEPSPGEQMRDHVARYLGISPNDDIILRFQDLGLFKDIEIMTTPLETGTPTSVTGSDLLVQLVCSHPSWNYHKGQRDLVVMEHIVIAQYPGGVEKELTSTLVLKGEPFQEKVFIEENHREERFGIKVETFADCRRGVYMPGVSAISATVGNTVAAAVVAYLTGETDAAPGIKYGPLTQETSHSLLKRLNDFGIRLIEKENIYDRNNPKLKRI